MDKATRTVIAAPPWRRGRRGAAAALAGVVSVAAVGAAVRAGGPGKKDERPAARKEADTVGWQAWEALAKRKDGSVEVRYRIRRPGSDVWTWQLRSTFPHPVRVDYSVTTFDPRGRPVLRSTIAYIAARGQTGEIQVVSRQEPFLRVEQVRAGK